MESERGCDLQHFLNNILNFLLMTLRISTKYTFTFFADWFLMLSKVSNTLN